MGKRRQHFARQRPANEKGIWSRKGITRQTHQKGFYRPSNEERQMREQEGNNVDWSIEGMPDPDDWKEQHKGDEFHHENGLGDLEYPDLYNNANTPEEDGSM